MIHPMERFKVVAGKFEDRTPDFEVFVPGVPRPQGSKTRTRYGGMRESSKYLKAWRATVKAAAVARLLADGMAVQRARGTVFAHDPLDGPLVLGAELLFPRPQDHYRRRACGNVHQQLGKRYIETCPNCALVLRETAPTYVTSKPDTGKCLRAIEDSLTDAGVWGDDSLVVGYAGFPLTAKRYANPGEQPGARIRIWRVS